MTNRIIVTFGEMLKEEFLEPMGISQYRLAKSIGVSPTLIGKIIKGKTSLTPDIAYRFSLFFGNSYESWINLQAYCDKQLMEEKYKNNKTFHIIPFGQLKRLALN